MPSTFLCRRLARGKGAHRCVMSRRARYATRKSLSRMVASILPSPPSERLHPQCALTRCGSVQVSALTSAALHGLRTKARAAAPCQPVHACAIVHFATSSDAHCEGMMCQVDMKRRWTRRNLISSSTSRLKNAATCTVELSCQHVHTAAKSALGLVIIGTSCSKSSCVSNDTAIATADFFFATCQRTRLVLQHAGGHESCDVRTSRSHLFKTRSYS
jgi:hypothetical protein